MLSEGRKGEEGFGQKECVLTTVCVSKTWKINKGYSCLFAWFLSKTFLLKLEVHILLSILLEKKLMKNQLLSQ